MLKAIMRDWNGFWFKRQASGPLGLLRIGVGLLTMVGTLQQFPDRYAFYSDEGVLPRNRVLEFCADYTPGPRPINPLMATDSHTVLTLFFIGFLFVTFLMTIGFFTRTSTILTAIGINALHNRDTIVNATGGDCMIIALILYLMMSNCGASCSVDRLIRVLRGREGEAAPMIAPWGLRLAQIQVSVCYITTFLLKMPGQLWQNGTAVYYPAVIQEFHRFPIPFLDGNHLWVINLLTYGTLAIEFSLATFVWVPRLRLYVLGLGVLLHLGIEYTLNIPLFGFIMMVSYISFLKQSDLDWVAQRLPGRIGLGRLRVVYDGECDFCRSTLLIVRYLDVFRLISYHDYHMPQELAEATGVRFEDADEAAIAVDDRDRQFAGYYAFRQIARRTPALWLFVPLMYVPGIPWLGNKAYAWVAANRKILPVAARYKTAHRPTVTV